jgi:arginine kinase
MSAHGLENFEFNKHEAALVNSTIISVERNFEGFPFGPGLLKIHRLQIMDLIRSACDSLPEDLQGTFYPLEGMSKDVQN